MARLLVFVLFLLAASAAFAGAAHELPAGAGQYVYHDTATDKNVTVFYYKPRNYKPDMPVVFVLTPESTGYTVSESPTLYYYVTDDTSFEFEITVNRDEQTLVQMRRCEKIKAGLHGISLGDLGIKLEEGADYEWNVALIPNPLQGSLDITSTGGIRRIKAKEPMKDFNDNGKHGIWYDMLQDLTEKITADPSNKVLLKERGDLFKQVGLPEVADLDYAAAKTKG